MVMFLNEAKKVGLLKLAELLKVTNYHEFGQASTKELIGEAILAKLQALHPLIAPDNGDYTETRPHTKLLLFSVCSSAYAFRSFGVLLRVFLDVLCNYFFMLRYSSSGSAGPHGSPEG